MTWNEQWKDIREQEDGRFNKLCETKMHYSTKAYWPGYYCKISYNCYYSSFTTSLSGKHCHKAAIELSHPNCRRARSPPPFCLKSFWKLKSIGRMQQESQAGAAGDPCSVTYGCNFRYYSLCGPTELHTRAATVIIKVLQSCSATSIRGHLKHWVFRC